MRRQLSDIEINRMLIADDAEFYRIVTRIDWQTVCLSEPNRRLAVGFRFAVAGCCGAGGDSFLFDSKQQAINIITGIIACFGQYPGVCRRLMSELDNIPEWVQGQRTTSSPELRMARLMCGDTTDGQIQQNDAQIDSEVQPEDARMGDIVATSPDLGGLFHPLIGFSEADDPWNADVVAIFDPHTGLYYLLAMKDCCAPGYVFVRPATTVYDKFDSVSLIKYPEQLFALAETFRDNGEACVPPRLRFLLPFVKTLEAVPKK